MQNLKSYTHLWITSQEFGWMRETAMILIAGWPITAIYSRHSLTARTLGTKAKKPSTALPFLPFPFMPLPMTTFFSGAHDFSVKELNVINAAPPAGDPLNGEDSDSAYYRFLLN